DCDAAARIYGKRPERQLRQERGRRSEIFSARSGIRARRAVMQAGVRARQSPFVAPIVSAGGGGGLAAGIRQFRGRPRLAAHPAIEDQWVGRRSQNRLDPFRSRSDVCAEQVSRMFSLEIDCDIEDRDLLIAELWEQGSAGIVELGPRTVRAFFE